jgi:hypothetical protein
VSGAEFTQGAALAALLGTEGFLLAAIALALRLDEPNQDGVQKRPWIGPPRRIAKGTVWVMAALAVGTFGAWWSIFGGGSWDGWTRAATGGALLIALVAQPVLGWLLAYGAERV